MTNKERFIELFKKNVKIDGANNLLDRLEKSDFYTAPASTKYHDSVEGGLVRHSLRVYDFLDKAIGKDLSYSEQTLTIVALLHDLCKIGFYTVEMRNNKNEKGQWEKVPYYGVDDKFPYGHGEKSVYLINEFFKLTTEEAMAIRFHMGAYEGEKIWQTLSSAFGEFPLALYLHIADMKATYLK